MTKIDLCDMDETKKWMSYYEELGYYVIGVDLKNNKNIDKIIDKSKEILNELNEIKQNRGINKKTLRALIIGIPNVGKSTLINRLVGKKVTAVGNKPGLTKSLDWIRIGEFLELLDSPGMLWPKIDDKTTALNLSSMTAIKEEILPIDEISIYILKMISKYYPLSLKERYGIEEVLDNNIIDVFDLIGKRRGAIVKGGEIDYQKVYNIIMRDLKEGYLGSLTFDRFDNMKEDKK
jgi:ribosome biogenesis GTPase A